MARDVDERERAVRTAFDRLCFMYIDAMSARSEYSLHWHHLQWRLG